MGVGQKGGSFLAPPAPPWSFFSSFSLCYSLLSWKCVQEVTALTREISHSKFLATFFANILVGPYAPPLPPPVLIIFQLFLLLLFPRPQPITELLDLDDEAVEGGEQHQHLHAGGVYWRRRWSVSIWSPWSEACLGGWLTRLKGMGA